MCRSPRAAYRADSGASYFLQRASVFDRSPDLGRLRGIDRLDPRDERRSGDLSEELIPRRRLPLSKANHENHVVTNQVSGDIRDWLLHVDSGSTRMGLTKHLVPYVMDLSLGNARLEVKHYARRRLLSMRARSLP